MGQTPETKPPSLNALHTACISGDLEAVRAAVDSGISIESVDTEHGNTPLMIAGYNRHPAVVSWLIGSGAAIEARCKENNTALMKSAWAGSIECVALLLQAGADVNAVENDGVTALTLAAFYGHTNVVRLLVAAGADVHRTDSGGFTALQNAQLQGHKHIVALLEAAPGTHDKLDETSTNFDPELVERFLIELAARIEQGFPTEGAVKLASEIGAMEHDDERMWPFRVAYEGIEMPLIVRAFRDDICSVCLAFQTGSRLVNAIDQQIEAWTPILEGDAGGDDQRQG
jgi:uncharacterized protein